ncbi:hypothetical protein [Opitutus terrae]|uniref:Lipoprotein n=1 Tax=Opitutus terrae (strain DSM 11246 / JCM 15787 / PB90-1) TaxID=452637 RepID=B1ZPP3_OPITP|nr:hypothetical protein [Opitutus terrae]ACB75496.1 hypothetical protein Oter_2213 [Opitutus terrae PB90-1]
MRSLRLVCVCVIWLSGVACGATTRDEAQRAIAALEKDVFSDEASQAASVIADFAATSEDVRFTLGPDTAPWVTEEHDRNEFDDAARAMLLAVYFAGNAKAQLARGQPGDDPYPGWLAVIAAYRRIQEKRPFIVPSLEHLAQLQQDGRLEQHARDVQLNSAALPTTPLRPEAGAPPAGTESRTPLPSGRGSPSEPSAPSPPLPPLVATTPDQVEEIGHEDQGLGLVFPGRLPGCVFRGVRRFEPAALGYSVTYRSNTGAEGALTCYIYDKGLPAIPTGGGSDVVRAEMAEVVSLIAPGWKERKGVVEPIVSTADIRNSDRPEPIAQLAVHRITVDKTANISVTVMTGYHDKFLKVRYTFPGHDPNTALRALTACWDAFAQANPIAAAELLGSNTSAAAAK